MKRNKRKVMERTQRNKKKDERKRRGRKKGKATKTMTEKRKLDTRRNETINNKNKTQITK